MLPSLIKAKTRGQFRAQNVFHCKCAEASFNRDGDDIRIRVPVRIDEAGLGAKIEVPTTDGRALRIPQGTKNGQKFRLREKGVLNSGAENGETRSCRWPYKLR